MATSRQNGIIESMQLKIVSNLDVIFVTIYYGESRNHPESYGYILGIILNVDYGKTIRPKILSFGHSKIYINVLLVLKV